ncbi:dTDP-4-dehydrorhamnose 3,5-epimerase [Bradyrhizobium sp. Arg237L]|uniref:dTDP-4-dehydrorhamnose 3,5-epimerase n=1 Tax=Bradyrhizobium sp. Arg237L TaxID=3003352 RepID=UPI00249D95D0|nr:dTDP-4-dehydrorhamnose 3,5-epimerase [Bradyrhizobium sp. Arg237L]MDI4232968.1 dTDP-4-dehydrorhamnose 3,5-epimerase [Bradyrhizobium sp. Arg237L]
MAARLMQFERLKIPELLLVSPKKHGDQRGFFSETFRADSFAAHGLEVAFVQDNHVYSAQKGVLRGLHFQLAPHAQGKLIRCERGAIYDVGVDIRVGSLTYGCHVGVELSAENWRQLWVPPGFAHGYVTLEENCEVIYKVTDYYTPECDSGLAWDDPALGIDWRLAHADITLSDKDRKHPGLARCASSLSLWSVGNL